MPSPGIKGKLLSKSFVDQFNSRDQIEEFGLGTSSNLQFGYRLRLANRSDSIPIFAIRYLIEGDIVPTPKIKIRKAGLSARQFSRTTSFFDDEKLFYPVSLTISIILSLVSVFLLGFSGARPYRGIRAKLMEQGEVQERLSDEEIEKIKKEGFEKTKRRN